ncbi:MAG: adenylate kinase [Heliobacteriaceae bacterium]|jgi:adenylate kinase|nr:adenylate kinase [Heliobacteriaceae bacterium]
MKKELIFLGPPASGKGTQTSRLSEYLGFPHVDTGGLLRAAIKNETSEGLEAKSYIDKGALVPIEIVCKLIKNRLLQDDCKNGYILDGFPRSVEQADMLEEINKEIDGAGQTEFKAIYFDIPEDLLIERIIYRRSCVQCGAIYNLKSLPPKQEGICDCGGDLTQRKDDNEETARARFETYFKETAPLVEYYEKKGVLTKLNANGNVEDIWNRLLQIIE